MINTWILKYRSSFLRIVFSILDFFRSFDWCQCFTSSYIQYVVLAIFRIFTVVLIWIDHLLHLDLCVVGLYGNYNTTLWCCMDRLQVCDLLLHWWCGLRESMFLLTFFNNVDTCSDLSSLRSISQVRRFRCSTSFCWSFLFFTLKEKASNKYLRIYNALPKKSFLCQHHCIFFLFKTKSFFKKVDLFLIDFIDLFMIILQCLFWYIERWRISCRMFRQEATRITNIILFNRAYYLK